MPHIGQQVEAGQIRTDLDHSGLSERRAEGFFRAAKAILVSPESLSVLVVRRRLDQPRKPGQWDVPGGELRLGERAIDGLIRETWEETGMTMRPEHFVELTQFGVKNERCEKSVFVGLDPGMEPRLTEHDLSKRVSLPEGAELLGGTKYGGVMLYLAGMQDPLAEVGLLGVAARAS